MAQDIERRNHADQDAVVVDHEQSMNFQSQQVIDHLGGGRIRGDGEDCRRHHVADARAVNLFDLEAAAKSYARTLLEIAGSPPVLDLVHLGLGPDGHTASLVPGDPVLDVADTDVALTGVYQGRRRMTLTYPVINRARRILWLVTGGEKAGPLVRLRAADDSIPAGRVRQDQALVLADRAAASGLGTS